MNKKKTKSGLFAIMSVILLTILDQITKWLAVTHIKGTGKTFDCIPYIVQLTYLENKGAAWGMFENMQWLFVVIGVLLIGFMSWYYMQLPSEKKYIPVRLCMVVLAAGALGNMIDRVINGYVVDFFEFLFMDFPIFNVADIYVTVSIFILTIYILFFLKEEDLQLAKKSGKEEQ